jgi:hypothetical protein
MQAERRRALRPVSQAAVAAMSRLSGLVWELMRG